MGECRSVTLPGCDEFDSSVLTFVDPVTIGRSPSASFVDRDESLQKRLFLPRFRRHCLQHLKHSAPTGFYVSQTRESGNGLIGMIAWVILPSVTDSTEKPHVVALGRRGGSRFAYVVVLDDHGHVSRLRLWWTARV